MGLIALSGLALIGWRLNVLGVRAVVPLGSVAIMFDQPPAYPGYTWTRDGHSVSSFELNTSAGPDHCGWEAATFLMIGWSPGTVSTTAAGGRQYIRDPKGALRHPSNRELLVLDATLPSDARPTGHRLGSIELYLSPSDQDKAIFVVGPAGAERWPRSDPMTSCR